MDNWTIKASTLDELAAKAKTPADTLKETVAKYNKSVEAGKDEEFRRSIIYTSF